MKTLLTLLLLAAAAAGAVEYEITIYGLSSGGFEIVYTWYAPAPEGAKYWITQELVGLPNTGEWRLGYHDRETGELYWQEYAQVHVDALSDIRPTPQEMEGE